MKARTALLVIITGGVALLLSCAGGVADAPVARELAPIETTTSSQQKLTQRYFLTTWGLLRAGRVVTFVEMHNAYVEDFIKKPGRGLTRFGSSLPWYWIELLAENRTEPNSKQGSVPGKPNTYDTINETLTLMDGTSRVIREQVWLIKHRRLMSVDAKPDPVVYMIDADGLFPDGRNSAHDLMKLELATGTKTPKRAFDPFETAALRKLHHGEDAVLQASDQELRVLGAIRARKECLSCHKVEVGTMLGAFTYTLTPQSEATPEADCLKELSGLTELQLAAIRNIESRGGKVIRTPCGPVTELQLTFARNQERESRRSGESSRLQLHDSELDDLAAFPEIRALDVSESLVSDASVKVLGALKRLKTLNLTGSFVTDAGAAALAKELPGCVILRTPDRPPPAIVPPR